MNYSSIKVLSVSLSFIIFFSTGCSNPLGNGASSVASNYGYGIVPPAPSMPGIISGSHQGGLSVLQRRSDISVGSVTGTLKLNTDSKRTVFVSIQGQIISK